MAEKNPDVIFAEIDATANEIKEVQIEGYPTILFFPKNKRDPLSQFDG